LPALLADLPSAKPRAPLAPAMGLDGEEGWQLVSSGRCSGRSFPLLSSKTEALERSLTFKRWARGRCLRRLKRGHQLPRVGKPFRCTRCRHPGHRERNCNRRLRSPVSRSPTSRSRSPAVGSPRPTHSRTWAEVVHPLSPPASPSSPPGVGRNATVYVISDFDWQAQVASLRIELLQLVADRIKEVTRPLRDEAAVIKLWLARAIGS
jgi:hypothetical protein